MAVQALDTSVDTLNDLPTLSDVYTPGASVNFGGLEAVPTSPSGLEAQICRSIYPLRNLYNGQFSSAILLSRYRYCRYGSYLYFGVTASAPQEEGQRFELMGLRDSSIKVELLSFDSPEQASELRVFFFISREDFSVSKLAASSCAEAGGGKIFAGFQHNSNFEWDDIENEYADYYPISDCIQRIYSTNACLSAHTSYAYSDNQVSWARSEEDFLRPEEIQVVSNIPLHRVLPGSAVLNAKGQAISLVSECWRQDMAPLIDLVPLSEAINHTIRRAIDSEVFRNFHRGSGTH